MTSSNKPENTYLMSLDLGTSTLKVAIYDLEGREVSFTSTEYPLSCPQKNMVENDLEAYWNKIVELIRTALARLDDPSRILALSLSSQGETMVPVDKDIKPLRPAIVWLDGRSGAQAEEIARNFNEDELFKITGCPSSDPSWPAARIKWIKENEPDIFKKTYKFLLLKDYIAYRLTGRIFGEATVYNSSYYFDIIKKEYYEPMLSYLGISRDKLPEIYPPATPITSISKEANKLTGLSVSTRFVTGAMDQVAGALGAGNISTGMATETTGTAFAMIVTTDGPVTDTDSKIPCQLHVAKDKYCLMPYSMTGGMVLKWFKDNFYKEANKSDNDIYDLMTGEAAAVAPGSDGLLMLPHLSGAFIPENNPNARGVFFGIELGHTRAHFIRSILESLGYMLKNDLKLFSNMGIDVGRIISQGGGAKSSLWCQIKADITGLEINVPKYTETALLGAAIIAGVGVGVYKSYDQAVREIVKIDSNYEPNPENRDIYRASFKKYNDLYSRVEGLF